ncbi:NAD-glutamate dehydrogenase [Methylomarinum vadi]|uniref:NAD-glutamate dehydrogenase n=1 Tax=Methylomarinum vadi TaxID=438855 RepID=UPI0004DEFF93|nr:NAD-glutamate dehydrogenase [Methylomarinum vadi]
MENNVSEKVLSHLYRYIGGKLEGKLAETLIAFSRHYYALVPFDDLEHIAVADLYGAVMSHWNLALQYRPGTQKVRVYNPTLEANGWQSRHTIVEIVIEDMPFLLQSISMEINQQGLTNHLVIHPVFNVFRGEQAELLDFAAETDQAATPECLLHLEIDRQTDQAQLDFLKRRLQDVLTDVRAATQDWQACLEKMRQVIAELGRAEVVNQPQADYCAFLQWLHDDHFVFLGYREYELVRQQDKMGFVPIADSGLGILRDSIAKIPETAQTLMTVDAFTGIDNADPLLLTKATSRSTVHRPVFMDYIGIKQYDADGRLNGEKRFLGLYSSSAYLTELRNIPLVRDKIRYVAERFAFRKSSHRARSLSFILQSLPRDEIFQADQETLFQCVSAVIQLQERQRVRVFARHDVYGHFISLLVFVPRERYHTESRRKIQQILMETFSAQNVDFSVQLSESILARIHFIIRTDIGCCIDYDVRDIEQKIIEALTEWQDELRSELLNYHGEAKANALFSHYQDSFSAAYREDNSSRTAVLDIERFEYLLANGVSAESLLYSPLTAARNKTLRFKLFSKGQASLSRSLPMLENMGVKVSDERPYAISRKGCADELWMHDFGLLMEDETGSFNLENLKPRFQEAFEQCWFGNIENDGFNQLIIKAGIDWRQVNIFRAFYLYLRQIGIAFSQAYVETTLANNPEVVRLLVHLFDQRFDPSLQPGENNHSDLITAIEQAIDKVSSLDEDRILRRFLNLIQAAVRTNYFREPKDERGVPYFAIKLDSKSISDIPKPIPYFEIFVYSPRIEGIHLRGGPVARGGLRWSDRREDFRTEVLGLMKAQMTKNAVIVPTGAKGGFIVKNLNKLLTAGERQQEVVQCYRILIKGLLDLTDNLQKGQVVKPEKVNCYDGDDTYLVVAADKGTAKFSDYANDLSLAYGFWLGDAFASGGSYGYDHKRMGITARGAWESVKHHFNRLGINYLKQPFTVVGIGGMMGDVFGNGMLLSNKIKLIASFDHEHIFLDPDPDPEVSYQERKRLFAIAGSAWSDYDNTLISKGGGVFSRQLKAIQLSPRIKETLNIRHDHIAPNELIKCLLCAPVDLLWNGGIGTYVKAERESNLSVGDRANDAVRVNGKELRCRAVAEGGNLGFTQAGRIEYARKGGIINTDSIDNSAGVDCSDHEVNIKIFLDSLVAQGDLTVKQRNQLLESMTDAVAELVLVNNAMQNRAISMIERTSANDLQSMQWLIEILENNGHLIRNLEAIPVNDVLQERQSRGKGLYRPEISVIMAYSKQFLKQLLLTELAQLDPVLVKQELEGYFPKILRQKYLQQIQKHYLAHEIVANCLVNALVNRMGIVFPFRVMDETGYTISATVTTYKRVCRIFTVDQLWSEIEHLHIHLAGDVVELLYDYLRKLVERAMHWFLSSDDLLKNEQDAVSYLNGIAQLKSFLVEVIPESSNRRIDESVDRLIQQGVPAGLALNIATMDMMYLCLDVIWLSKNSNHSLQECAQVFFALMESLELLWLREQINKLPEKTVWQALARRTSREEFNGVSCALSLSVLQLSDGNINEKLKNWFAAYEVEIDRYRKLLVMVKSDTAIELEKVTVLLKELQDIAGCSRKVVIN